MATTLERALASSIATFNGCSGKEGDKHQLNKGDLKETPIFMGVSVGTPGAEPHQHPHVSPHHWARCGVQGRARSSLKQGPPSSAETTITVGAYPCRRAPSLTPLVLCARNNWVSTASG